MKSIFQISDCHLSDPSSFENLRKALLCAQNDSSCDTLFLTGDLCCNPQPGAYLSLVNFIEQHTRNKRIFAIAGNHDDHELMKQELRGSCIAAVNKAKLHGREIIFLNSSAKPLDKRHPFGKASSSRCNLRTWTRYADYIAARCDSTYGTRDRLWL